MPSTIEVLREMPEAHLGRLLSYAGLVLVAYELINDMVVEPIRLFYRDTTFHEGFVFKSYEDDVLSRHRNVFEASLLYLRDLMEAIDSADMLAIQALRKHRNELAHELAAMLPTLRIEPYVPLFKDIEAVIFKLSNYRFRMEVGLEPEVQAIGDQVFEIRGHEYLIFSEITRKIQTLSQEDAA